MGVHKYKSNEKLYPHIQIFANLEEVIDNILRSAPHFSEQRQGRRQRRGLLCCGMPPPRRVSCSQSRRDECSRRTHRQLSCLSFITCFWIQTTPARLTWRVVPISDSNSCPFSVLNPVTSRATLFQDALVVFRTPGQGVQAAQHQPTPAFAAQGEFLKIEVFILFFGQVTLCQSEVSVAGP